MSKKKKKKRVRSRIPPVTTRDRHHLLFTKSSFSKGYGHLLCMAFVRYVPVVYHRELHHNLRCVPAPDDKLLKSAWLKYQENKTEIDSYDAARAAAWLYVNIPDEAFRKAMQYQVDFFATRTQGGVL